MNIPVATRVVKPIKTDDLRKIRNGNKLPEVICFNGKYTSNHPNCKF